MMLLNCLMAYITKLEAYNIKLIKVMEKIQDLAQFLNTQILGQAQLVNRMLVALLCDGHLLVEGAPGLAKTTAIKALSRGIEADFSRIQFTPDLLPADLTGTEIYKAQTATFEFQKGPIFSHFILADEINRSPAKVQSALLEAMGERQVSVARTTYPLPALFLVMATQNPIEQEGTYPLPEAQLDRFLLHIELDYPSIVTEQAVLQLMRDKNIGKFIEEPTNKLSQADLFKAREAVLAVHMATEVEEYLLNIVQATRLPGDYSDKLNNMFEYGASTRASLALDRTCRAYAYLDNRDFVTSEDVQLMAFDVLRHRIILTFSAETKGISKNDAIKQVLENVSSA